MFIRRSPIRSSRVGERRQALASSRGTPSMRPGASPGRCAANGIPYQGINVLMLWSAAIEKGYAAPIWMTFKQALELKAHVRKGEHGSLVVYADKIIRTETDAATGEESERAIPFMKGYTVFNVEQIDGLPEHFYAKAAPRTRDRAAHRARGAVSLPRPAPTFATAATAPTTAPPPITCRCRPSRASATRKAITPRSRMRRRTGRATRRALTATSAASASAMKATRWKSLSPSLAPPSFPPTSN